MGRSVGTEFSATVTHEIGAGGYPTILFGSLAKVPIYRGPILRLCRTRKEVVQEVRDTVVHEIGHHFGFDDDEMPY